MHKASVCTNDQVGIIFLSHIQYRSTGRMMTSLSPELLREGDEFEFLKAWNGGDDSNFAASVAGSCRN